MRSVPLLPNLWLCLCLFKVQEIQDKGGMYYGQNAISNNLILCNKENLLNQSSILLGVPGAGKSFLTKQQIENLLLSTDDEIMICDPENEYGALVKALCPDAAVISLEASGQGSAQCHVYG